MSERQEDLRGGEDERKARRLAGELEDERKARRLEVSGRMRKSKEDLWGSWKMRQKGK